MFVGLLFAFVLSVSISYSQQNNGTPFSITISTEQEQLYADNSSTTKGMIHVFDESHIQLQDGIVSVFVDSGAILTNDIDNETKGTQIRLENGVAEFEYQSGNNAGVAIITAKMEHAEGTKEIFLNTPNEPVTIIGLVNGSVNAASRKGNASALQAEKSFPDKTQTDGRAAVYARGTVMQDYLLTFSYDSDRRNRSRLFRDIDPDYLYSIYVIIVCFRMMGNRKEICLQNLRRIKRMQCLAITIPI